LLDIFLLAAM